MLQIKELLNLMERLIQILVQINTIFQKQVQKQIKITMQIANVKVKLGNE